MGWYDSAWTRRQAVAVNAVTANAASIDISIDLPAIWGEFWENVDADGDDIRVTRSDGTTLLGYKLANWNSTNKVGLIEIDAYDSLANAQQDATVVVFVYWGNGAASAAANANLTIANAKAGTVYLAEPGTGSYPIIRVRPSSGTTDIAAATIAKQPTETIRVWWDLSEMMALVRFRNQRSNRLEEIDYFTFYVENVNAVHQAAMYDETKNYIKDPYMVSTYLSGGVDENNYLLKLVVYTT